MTDGPGTDGSRETNRQPILTRLTLSAAAFLFAINYYICREIFRVEYTRHWISIEGAYIGLSRYILKHWPDFNWFPLWYGGIPYQNTYPPLLHMLTALDARVLGISTAQAYHAVSGTFYCLGPVALFFLLYALSDHALWTRFTLSFSAALLFAFTSPSALVLHKIRGYMYSMRGARRLHTLVVDGDAPHIASITLLLIAILALHLAIERGGAVRAWAAILAFAAVVLTNWLGTFTLAMACFCYLLARSSVDRGRLRSIGMNAGITAGIGIVAFCLIVPWIPPSTLGDIQRNAQFNIGEYHMGVRQFEYWGVLLIACAILWWVLTKYRVSLCTQFGSYFLLLMAALTIPDDLFQVYLIPQPHRYQHELEIGMAIVAAFALGPLLFRLAGKYQALLAIFLLIEGVLQVRAYRRDGREKLRSGDVHQAVEYQAGTWLQTNLPNQRLFALGSVQFWLLAFADNPQIGGGFGQGTINNEIPMLQYGVPFTKGDGERTAMWLRLFGIQAIAISGPTGRDAYKEAWSNGDKFQGVLPELWRNGEDAIYGVPQRSTSLAHVILAGDVASRPPVNIVDLEPVRKLDLALADPSLPDAGFTWRGQGAARISGILKPEHLVFVQESYHPGWTATVNGQPRPIRRDGLGFMVIEPHCDGPCEIDLSFDGGAEMHLAKIVRMLGIAAALVWMLLWVGMTRYRFRVS